MATSMNSSQSSVPSSESQSTSPPTSSSSSDSSTSSSDRTSSGSSTSNSSSSSSNESKNNHSTSSSSSSSDEEYHDDLPCPEATAAKVSLTYFTDVPFRIANLNFIAPHAHRAIVKEWSTQLGCWVSRQTSVLYNPKSFARGCMRSSYHLIDLQCPQKNFVAKQYRKKSVLSSQYFDDVAMHSIAEHWANQFNIAGAPKRVRFVPAAVLELPFSQPPQVFAIEPHLVGEFKKHNNNNGYVAEDKRNTPQAFSHFTLHRSQGQLLIVDIQGVGDDYTDPQIMSVDGEGYGRGNLGVKGMEKFIKTHQCNAVCLHLELPELTLPPKKVVRRGKGSPPSGAKPPKSPLNGGATPRPAQHKLSRRTSSQDDTVALESVSRQLTGDANHLAATSAISVSSPPQYLPPVATDRPTPKVTGKKGGGKNHHRTSLAQLRESMLIDAPSISIAPPPRAESVETELFPTTISEMMMEGLLTSMNIGEQAAMSGWGTLAYIETMLNETQLPERSEGSNEESARRALDAEYLRIVEQQAKRKADKDAVMVDDE